jgi:ubiquinone/menaquinone biosynthesis C-methylase UbiE
MRMNPYLKKIENAYDEIAGEWAEAFACEHEKKPKDRELLDRFAREIGNRKPVWDFGCGTGNTTKYLKDRGIEISGLDLSGKMLEQARANYPQIHFRKGDILDLAFEDETLAGIVAFYAIVHFTGEQVRTAFREVFRVLQRGGIFFLTYHVGGQTIHLDGFLGKRVNIDVMFFDTDFIFNILRESGFEKIEIIEREPYPGVEYQSRRAYVFAIKGIHRSRA